MNLSMELDLISLASFVLSIASFVLVCVIFSGIQNLRHKRRDDHSIELTAAVSKKIEETVERLAGESLESSKTQIDSQIGKFSEELQRLLHARSSELSAYTEKIQQDQVKQSQFYVANMLAKIEADAQSYRENKFKEIDQEIRQIVLAAAREVIGRAISLSEHEDLVNKALEKAKRDKLFS